MTQASFDAMNSLRPASNPKWDLPHLEALLQTPHREAFEESWLPQAMTNQRWFGGKGKSLRNIRIVKHWPLAAGASQALWLAVRVEYSEGPGENYQVAFAFAECEEGQKPDLLLAGKPGKWVDAFATPWFVQEILRRMTLESGIKPGNQSLMALLANGDKMECEAVPALREALVAAAMEIKPLTADQSNSASLIADRYFIKFYRRLEAGVSPEAEMVRYLGEAGYAGTPAWRGEWRLRPQGGEAIALAIVTDQVAHPENFWNTLLGRLRRAPTSGDSSESLGLVAQLGAQTARMHMALARGTSAAFAPQPFSEGEPARWADGIAEEVKQSLVILQTHWNGFGSEAKRLAEFVLAQQAVLLEPLERLRQMSPKYLGLKTRAHGDYHLGQVLAHDGGIAILDFEGEPARSLAERRAKATPLRDVAGMLRSLHYVSVAARILPLQPGEVVPAAAMLHPWHRLAHEGFLNAYRSEWATDPQVAAELLPTPEGFKLLLDALLLEKAAYELRYEAQNRPEWVEIPLNGLSLLAQPV
jgi:trehalose synthase-fused probable maltokinase